VGFCLLLGQVSLCVVKIKILLFFEHLVDQVVVSVKYTHQGPKRSVMNLNKRDAAGVVVLIIIVIVRLGLNGGSVLTACSTSTLLLAAATYCIRKPVYMSKSRMQSSSSS
jgi:uncharacterized membrane protein YobD (UPF0266 family)